MPLLAVPGLSCQHSMLQVRKFRGRRRHAFVAGHLPPKSQQHGQVFIKTTSYPIQVSFPLFKFLFRRNSRHASLDPTCIHDYHK